MSDEHVFIQFTSIIVRACEQDHATAIVSSSICMAKRDVESYPVSRLRCSRTEHSFLMRNILDEFEQRSVHVQDHHSRFFQLEIAAVKAGWSAFCL